MTLRKVMRILFYPWALLAALVLIFEEWLWAKVSLLMLRLAQTAAVQFVEKLICRLPPYLALAFLLFPWFILLPAKLVAVWLFSQGHTWIGILIIFLAKVIGTAFVARIFSLTRQSVFKISWFHRFYKAVLKILIWARKLIRNSRSYQFVKRIVSAIKAKLKKIGKYLFG